MQLVEMRWQGPLQGPDLLKALNYDGESILDQWGVYVAIQKFPRITVAYAGEAKGLKIKNTIKDRWWSHIDQFRKLNFNLHVVDPKKPVREGRGGFSEDAADPTYEYRAIEKKSLTASRKFFLRHVAEKEIEKIELYFCRFPDPEGDGAADIALLPNTDIKAAISEVEGQLIRALYELEAGHDHFACDNSKSGRAQRSFRIDLEAFKSWILTL